MKNGPYILVIAPNSYPGKKYRNRYVYEHQLVWWKNTGNLVGSDEIIHHINHNKHDNRFENLELQKRADHSILHGSEQFKSTICSWCFHCKNGFELDTRNFKSRIKVSKILFCGRSCQVKQQWINKKV